MPNPDSTRARIRETRKEMRRRDTLAAHGHLMFDWPVPSPFAAHFTKKGAGKRPCPACARMVERNSKAA